MKPTTTTTTTTGRPPHRPPQRAIAGDASPTVRVTVSCSELELEHLDAAAAAAGLTRSALLVRAGLMVAASLERGLNPL